VNGPEVRPLVRRVSVQLISSHQIKYSFNKNFDNWQSRTVNTKLKTIEMTELKSLDLITIFIQHTNNENVVSQKVSFILFRFILVISLLRTHL